MSRRIAPAGLVALAVVIAVAWTLPGLSRQPFLETTTWSFVVVTAFLGWGSAVAFVVDRRTPETSGRAIDLGLRATWGAAAMAFLGGLLMVFSLMTRTAAMLLVESGAVLALLTLAHEHRAVRERFRFFARCARREPRLMLVAGVVVALLAIHYVAGVAEWHRDPYDDDIAYLAFSKKLLDTGSFPEPFSFRRLAALGGQTFFVSLVQLRGAPHQAHTFDRSICILLVTLLVIGHRSRGRRPSVLFLLAGVLVVPLMPLVTRNTASHYSAIAFFLALFRTAVWATERERPAWQNALPLALVAVVICTLRQSYLPIPIVFLVFGYAAARRWKEPLYVLGFATAAILPWLIAGWQSNRTFLYPLVGGTINHALELRSNTVTLPDEIAVVLRTALEGFPLYTFGLFFMAAMLTPEQDRRRPLLAFVVASLVGFLLLCHAINQGDPYNLGRYASGFVVAAALATMLTTGLARFHGKALRIHAAAAICALALLLQLGRSADGSFKFYARALHNVDIARAEARNERVSQPTYRRVQESVPAGARLAVLLDEPHWLDFGRNPIWNFDMPGYSSLAPGMPFFHGSQKLEAYFHEVGIRYLAFVRSDRSTYHYRRDYWMLLLVDEMDIWRTFAPYVIDFTDNLLDIATRHRRLYDKDGIVVLDLAEPATP